MDGELPLLAPVNNITIAHRIDSTPHRIVEPLHYVMPIRQMLLLGFAAPKQQWLAESRSGPQHCILHLLVLRWSEAKGMEPDHMYV